MHARKAGERAEKCSSLEVLKVVGGEVYLYLDLYLYLYRICICTCICIYRKTSNCTQGKQETFEGDGRRLAFFLYLYRICIVFVFVRQIARKAMGRES